MQIGIIYLFYSCKYQLLLCNVYLHISHILWYICVRNPSIIDRASLGQIRRCDSVTSGSVNALRPVTVVCLGSWHFCDCCSRPKLKLYWYSIFKRIYSSVSPYVDGRYRAPASRRVAFIRQILLSSVPSFTELSANGRVLISKSTVTF